MKKHLNVKNFTIVTLIILLLLSFLNPGGHLPNVGLGVANRVFDGTNGEFTPYVDGGVYWKIRLKK